MSTDNTPAASEATDLSPEVADALGLSPSQPKSVDDTVKPDEAQDKKPLSEKKTDVKKSTETKKTDGDDKKSKSKSEDKTEDKDEEAQPQVFEVAGKKYSSIEDASKAINRIAGDNQRLTGDIKAQRQSYAEAENKINDLTKILADYQQANKQWEDYYKGNGAQPNPDTAINLESTVKAILDKERQQEKQTTTKVQYQTELDEVVKEDDFKQVLPFFKELVDEYDGTPKVSPKKLYDRARLQYKNSIEEKIKDPQAFEDEVNARVEREIAKRGAAKVSAGGGQRPATKAQTNEAPLSPEVQDALKDFI